MLELVSHALLLPEATGSGKIVSSSSRARGWFRETWGGGPGPGGGVLGGGAE